MSADEAHLGRESLLAALERNQVRYIVIGGAAAEARGWRGRTVDVDIVPQSEPVNLAGPHHRPPSPGASL